MSTDQSNDPWAPATVTDAPTYEQQLDAAGYGDAQRQRYIEESGQDPEYAECMWDEMVVPAAEASGEIPAAPAEPVSPAERAGWAARDQALRMYWEQNPVEQGGYDPLSSNNNQPGVEERFNIVVDQMSTQILQDVGIPLAESIEQSGTWSDNTVDELYAQRHAAPDDEHEIEI
ncbi:hypothetical protein [Streptomyces sp. NBC_01197]|uniref:hypothetical protein n=1 Tax=Streptomyces sp. NBC_01197 TaxID=2903768 RepID=UPI002E1521F0|nr:hypothetical protein OG452_35195 [Streptomyces sp. NBC_01197]